MYKIVASCKSSNTLVCDESTLVEALRGKAANLRMHAILLIEHPDRIAIGKAKALIDALEERLCEAVVLCQHAEHGGRQLFRIAHLNDPVAAEA